MLRWERKVYMLIQILKIEDNMLIEHLANGLGHSYRILLKSDMIRIKQTCPI
jgi:hypothetical protein